jgi:hypothetical protein
MPRCNLDSTSIDCDPILSLRSLVRRTLHLSRHLRQSHLVQSAVSLAQSMQPHHHSLEHLKFGSSIYEFLVCRVLILPGWLRLF